MNSSSKYLALAVAVVILALASIWALKAQQPLHPYASLATRGASYAGPRRAASFDLPRAGLHIGLWVPLRGPDRAAGEAVIKAARLALRDAARRGWPAGMTPKLAIADASGPAWGRADDRLLQLIFGQNTVALLTTSSGNLAHLSLQVGNKVGLPVMTLSSDTTVTQIDMPWIFRLAPGDRAEAQALARAIYQRSRQSRVLIVASHDQDGRAGLHAFQRAVRALHALPPSVLQLDPLRPGTAVAELEALLLERRSQAIVLWTQPSQTRRLLYALRAAQPAPPIYLPQSAAQVGAGLSFTSRVENAGNSTMTAASARSMPAIYTVAASGAASARRVRFVRNYRHITGQAPSPVADEAYDAIRLIAAALRHAGPNRARVRDWLASGRGYTGISGAIRFDNRGNNSNPLHLLALSAMKRNGRKQVLFRKAVMDAGKQ